MEVNVFQFSNRVLIIDKSNDDFVRAKIINALDKNNLLFRVFDITQTVPTDKYFINLFRYHSGLKLLSNTIIPKPRKASHKTLLSIDKARLCLYEFLSAVQSNYNSLDITTLTSICRDTDSLKGLEFATDKQLAILSDADSRNKINGLLSQLSSSALFNGEYPTPNSGRQELDLSLFVHCDIPVFLFTPEHETTLMTDNLLKAHLKTALKTDSFRVDANTQRNIDALVSDVLKFNVVPISTNSFPIPSTLEKLMA